MILKNKKIKKISHPPCFHRLQQIGKMNLTGDLMQQLLILWGDRVFSKLYTDRRSLDSSLPL